MRTRAYALSIGAGVAACALIAYPWRCPEVASGSVSPPAVTPAQVKVAVVGEREIPQYLLLTGELRAERESAVATDRAGIIVQASLERGMAVGKGEALVKLDDREALLAVREAEANRDSTMADLEHAKREFDRNGKLAGAKVVSDSSLEKAKADYDMRAAAHAVAEVRLNKAKKDLADRVVMAPFAGFVVERKVQIGEYVQPGTVVAQLMEVGTLRLALNVPETAVGSISEGQEVLFTVGAYPCVAFSGKVRHVGAAVRGGSRDLVIEAGIVNSDGRLKPGMFASAKLRLDTASRTVVPKNALRADGASSHVFVVRGGRVDEKLVEPGVSETSWVEVRGGLVPGEMVVLDPEIALRDGAKVRMCD